MFAQFIIYQWICANSSSSTVSKELELTIFHLQITYDYLIVALGLQLHFEKVSPYVSSDEMYTLCPCKSSSS